MTPTLDGVRRKHFVQCGVTTGVAGFATPDARGEWRGLDVDVCRAIAAAVLGDAKKVRFTPLGIDRGVNRLWKDGGVMYVPPLR